MELGAFSIRQGGKDPAKSQAFYEVLGFTQVAGEIGQNLVIMRNAGTVIGLFQGMFEGAVRTVYMGWDQFSNTLETFEDVRDLKGKVQAAGLEISRETGDAPGPASFMPTDPDGNPVLIDPHR